METSVYKGYKQDKIEMRGDRAEMSDFPLDPNMVAGGLDCRDQAIGGFSFVVKIYAVPVQIKKLSYYLDNWDSIDFDDKRKAADGLISTIKATSDHVQIEWKI